MTYPTKITVNKGGSNVFIAEAGRFGKADSACRDFMCFASPIIGAAYHYLSFEDAARQIAESGYATVIVQDDIETHITPRCCNR